MGAILGFVLKLLGGNVADRAFSYLEKRADSETERQKIQAARENAANTLAADVVKTGMQHRMFWVAWSLAALPLAAWFAWGTLDTLLNGALPDVATLPPQLKEYADVVWSNIFYTGAGVAGASSAASIIGSAIARRRK